MSLLHTQIKDPQLSPGIIEEANIITKVQKLEATNPSLRRFTPKPLTFLKNFTSRPHGIAHDTTC